MQITDNGDTIPTIRPLHITLFYINHIQALKKQYGMTVLYLDGELLNTFLKELSSKIVVQPTFTLCYGLLALLKK